MPYKPILINVFYKNELGGKAGISQCPGKNLKKGRDGRAHERSITEDLENFKSRGISVVICLLNDSELRSIGVCPNLYRQAAERLEIVLIQFPIIEMGIPESCDMMESGILDPVIGFLAEGRCINIHCRGGIGRAGTIAVCLLKRLKIYHDPDEAVAYIRHKRDKRCVESSRQYDFIRRYFNN